MQGEMPNLSLNFQLKISAWNTDFPSYVIRGNNEGGLREQREVPEISLLRKVKNENNAKPG